MSNNNPMVAAARENASYYMDKILALFKPGAKITVMVRQNGKPEQDFLLTNDDLGLVSEMLARSMQRKEVIAGFGSTVPGEPNG